MKKEIKINGMSCGHCATHVEKAFKEIEGVINASVDLLERKAIVELSKHVDNERFKEALEEEDYELVDIRDI